VRPTVLLLLLLLLLMMMMLSLTSHLHPFFSP
jgi:hypothetical protein